LNGNRRERLGGRRGLEILEGFEGAEVEAVGGIDVALKAGDGIEGIAVGAAERGIVAVGMVEAFDAVIPELGFDAAEAALGPFGGDEGVDERELVGVGGVKMLAEGRGEGFELGGIFAGDDLGVGVDTRFQGVEGGDGFAFGGSGAGGFLGVETIGVDLGFGGHSWGPRI
jgi:hypothetical protein